MSSIPTVKIEPSDPEQGAFVVINEEDFDPAKGHVLYAEPVAIEPVVRRSKKQAEEV